MVFLFQAHCIKEIRQPDEIELHQCKEIVDCEITRVKFSINYVRNVLQQTVFKFE